MSQLNTVYVRNTDLLSADMDGEVVMMSISEGQYYGVSGVAALVWNLLKEPISLSKIVACICEEFEVSEQMCTIDLLRFIEELQQRNMIKTVK